MLCDTDKGRDLRQKSTSPLPIPYWSHRKLTVDPSNKERIDKSARMTARQAALLEWDINLSDPEQGHIALAVEQVRKYIYPRNLYQVGSARPRKWTHKVIATNDSSSTGPRNISRGQPCVRHS